MWKSVKNVKYDISTKYNYKISNQSNPIDYSHYNRLSVSDAVAVDILVLWKICKNCGNFLNYNRVNTKLNNILTWVQIILSVYFLYYTANCKRHTQNFRQFMENYLL